MPPLLLLEVVAVKLQVVDGTTRGTTVDAAAAAAAAVVYITMNVQLLQGSWYRQSL